MPSLSPFPPDNSRKQQKAKLRRGPPTSATSLGNMGTKDEKAAAERDARVTGSKWPRRSHWDTLSADLLV